MSQYYKSFLILLLVNSLVPGKVWNSLCREEFEIVHVQTDRFLLHATGFAAAVM